MPRRKKEKPQVMVTGAGGVLARHVIKRLRRTFDIVAVDFRYKVETRHAVASYHMDLAKRDFEDIFRKHNLMGVIHIGRVGTSVTRRKQRYNANVLGTQHMFDLCRQYGVERVLVMSSYFVYGAHPFNPALLNEEAPLKASDLSSNMIDSVELENLSNLYLWRYPELNMTILRPCNIVGPGVRNNLGRLFSLKRAPVLVGFSPVMQFIHVEDMAEGVIRAFRQNKPGIYNVAPKDVIAYKDALKLAGCTGVPMPSVPGILPRTISRVLNWKALPSYLINYFKHPVVLDGSLFEKTFRFKPKHTLDEIFAYYKDQKEMEKVWQAFTDSVQ